MSKSISVQLITDEKSKVTVAKVVANVWGSDPAEDVHGEAVGTAKCMEPDVFDRSVGTRLALGRALKALGSELVREAHQDIRDRDREREARLQSSQEALERKKAYRYEFECEFAELINAKLAEEIIATDNDTVPDQRFHSTGSILRDNVEKNKKGKPRGKARQIREELPA